MGLRPLKREQALYVAQIEALKKLKVKAPDEMKPAYDGRIAALEKELEGLKASAQKAN